MSAEHRRMYRTNINDVPKVEGLKREDGWIDMQVQFLIDKKSAGADHVVGWTVLRPGASHERHLHRNCDEFFIVLKGRGHIITEEGLKPSVQGDVVYSPRGCWHGFNNTSDEEVVLVWGWMGAGSSKIRVTKCRGISRAASDRPLMPDRMLSICAEINIAMSAAGLLQANSRRTYPFRGRRRRPRSGRHAWT